MNAQRDRTPPPSLTSRSNGSSSNSSDEEGGKSRIGPRTTTRSGLVGFLKLVIFGLVAIMVVLAAVIMIRVELEKRRYQQAPSTLDLYKTNQVCAMEYSGYTQTYETLKHAIGTDVRKILNCGPCGQCSNVHDIAIYHHTRNTPTEDATTCARVTLLFGYPAGSKFLKDQVGLTDGCNECWMQNVVCSLKNCLATCAKHRIFGWMLFWEKDNPADRLDPCHECDEVLCGPAFLECAGANRRKVGVVSDIARDEPNELCEHVDMEWLLHYNAQIKKGEDDMAPHSNDIHADEEL